MLRMAKKSTKTDRHKSPQMTIRLGEPARSVLAKLKALEDRTFTSVISRALKLYAEKNGVEWKADDDA